MDDIFEALYNFESNYFSRRPGATNPRLVWLDAVNGSWPRQSDYCVLCQQVTSA